MYPEHLNEHFIFLEVRRTYIGLTLGLGFDLVIELALVGRYRYNPCHDTDVSLLDALS